MMRLVVESVGFTAENGTRLIANASFALEPGARLAIAGPNGAGKTTLMNLLAGVVTPTDGRIRFDGADLATLPAHDRARRIAFVSQHGNPDGRLGLRDYVALGQMPIWADHGPAEHADALDGVLEMTGLSAKSVAPMAHLSGGERQRAHIARALAQRPQLLLLDEPTNHLDPDAKGQMLSLTASLGITVVMILHDLVLIPEFASHAALVHGGRLTAFGPVDEVLTPIAVRTTFGVDYLLLPHGARQVPALDIRNTNVQQKGPTL
ncbi:MAG: ABC transporter ATP-binding protein [Pseudomonadota bacterium]